MNKTMLCIQILQILGCKDIVSKKQIADILELNPRTVQQYIKTLQESGYDIESLSGVYGGYRLNKDGIIPAIKLNKKEVQTLKSSILYLEHQSDFLDYNCYAKAISKVLSSDVDTKVNDITIIDQYPLSMNKEELVKRYDVFAEAMTNNQKCLIVYISTHNVPKNHIIHPYKVFIYNGCWFVLAWNESVNNFGYFKLNRIENVKILADKFTISKTYHESDYIDTFGMKQNGEYYDIKLELKDLFTIVNERIYGKNQKITKVDERTTILECSMQNKNIIKSFVLGFGKKAKVLVPEWLKEAIINEAKAILEYNEEN